MAITSTNLSNAMMRYYAKNIQNLVYDKSSRPLLSMLPKDTSFGGELFAWPIKYEGQAGRSVSFAAAQAAAAAAKYVQGQLKETDLASLYGVLDIETRALRAGAGNPRAFLTKQVLLFDAIINDLANDIETLLFRDGTGVLGVVSSVVNNSPSAGYMRVTLTNADDTKNFEVGMPLECDAASSGATPIGNGVYGVVSNINHSAGTIDIIDDVSDTFYTALAANDVYLFGYGNAGETNINGLGKWIPATSPTDTLYNINRLLNPTKLGGNRTTGDLGAIENSIFDSLNSTKALAGRYGRDCFLSPTTWGLLAKELGQTVMRAPRDGKGGYSTLSIDGPDGPCSIISAPKCPPNEAWIIDVNTFKLMSMGETIGIMKDDGQMIVRRDASDALEARAVSFSQLICMDPSVNCHIAFSS